MAKRISIKRRLLVFSVALFLAIFIIGGAAFALSMRGIIHSGKESELQQIIKIKRLELESSVDSEVALALKMADSPLIKEYFLNPGDPVLERLAFKEIAGYRRAFTGNIIFWINNIDHRYYFGSEYSYTLDPKAASSVWYTSVIQNPPPYVFNVDTDLGSKQTFLWINVPIVEEGKKQAAGIVGTGINLSNFVDAIYKNHANNAEFYFFNASGEVTGASDVNLVLQKTPLNKLLGESGEKILDIAKNLSPDKIESFAASEGEVAVSAVPALGWYIVAIHPVSTEDYLKTNMTFTYISMMLVIAFIFIIFNMFISRIIKPLKIGVETLKAVSTNWDLTRRIENQPNNEIGDIAFSFNKLMDALREPISETKFAVNGLASTSDELTSVSANLSSSSEKTVSQTVSVASTTEQMSVNINAMASGAEQASANANEVAGAAEEMSVNMNTIASAIEEMSASINQISSNASEARSVASTANQKSSDATEVMNKLGEAAKEIGQVTDVIKKIADKTNLLALNATIEAASAGEAGKGFAVVAGEIKELANQSAKSADDIANRIEGIQSETNDAISVISDVSEIIVKINQSVEAIAGHVEQQTKASNEIANNVSQANTGAKRVASAISEVAKGVNDVSKNASEAAIGARNVSDNVSNVSGVAKESSQEASKVNGSARSLSEMAERLSLVMNKFRV